MGDPTTEPAVSQRTQQAIDDTTQKVLGGISDSNLYKRDVVEAIKKAVTDEMKKDGATKETISAAIVKAVNDTLPKKEEPKGDDKAIAAFKAEREKEQKMLQEAADTLGEKVMELKRAEGVNAPRVFEARMDSAKPLPISTGTLIGAGTAAAVSLFRPWNGIKNIALNLTMIAAGVGAGAYLSGDLTYLTSKKSGPSKDGPSPS